MKYWTMSDVKENWVKRDAESHKGSNGKIGIIAGSRLMPGAAILSSKAAVYSGAGLTILNTEESVIPMVAGNVPEVTYYSREDNIDQFIDDKDVIALGPGVGKDDSMQSLLKKLLIADQCPLVVDADGLFRLSELTDELNKRAHPVVITPHPGEMANINDMSVKDVVENRLSVAKKTAETLNVYVVLKGPETLIVSPKQHVISNTSGNAGLAKGGSGDVLTGIVTAFLGRYNDVMSAVASAVYLHGYTAECLVADGTAIETVTPTMLIDHFRYSFDDINI